MKLSSVLVLITMASASAFASRNNVRFSSRRTESRLFVDRDSIFDGSIVGDRGFDPLGFSKNKPSLLQYREAEVKHARLAMLAAVGWPISEVFHGKIAAGLHLPAFIDDTGRAPSIANGGLSQISPFFWIVCVLAASFVEMHGLSRIKPAYDYVPGDLGFDPLGLYPKDVAGQRRMQLAEIRNGRLAMIAVVSFAVQEYTTQMGVVRELPAFAQSASMAVQEYVNQGQLPQ